MLCVSQMSENSFLARDVDLEFLAEVTKNFSGAEIEGLVKDAAAYALNRQVDFNDLSKPVDEEAIKVGLCVCACVCMCARALERARHVLICCVGRRRVSRSESVCVCVSQVTQADFDKALEEVKPAFGAAIDQLKLYSVHGIVSCGDAFDHIMHTLRTLVHQVKHSEKTPLLTCVLEGPVGSGKSSMAATVALESEFPFMKVISPETLVGYSEQVSGVVYWYGPLVCIMAMCAVHDTMSAGMLAVVGYSEQLSEPIDT